MLTRRRVIWALVILAAACTLEVVIVCYAPQPIVKVEKKSFPDPSGKFVCVLTTRRWVNDDMPFQFMLSVYDARGNPLRNGTWVTGYYIQTVAWNGDKFAPWDAESPLNGGTCRDGKVYWDAEADVQGEKALSTTRATTEPGSGSIE